MIEKLHQLLDLMIENQQASKRLQPLVRDYWEKAIATKILEDELLNDMIEAESVRRQSRLERAKKRAKREKERVEGTPIEAGETSFVDALFNGALAAYAAHVAMQPKDKEE